jgi:sulfatase modifying factor 1
MTPLTRAPLAAVVMSLLGVGCVGCGDDSGASDASVAVDVGSSTGGCPELGGPMIRVPVGFCIDRTEVTRGNYFEWLATDPPTAGEPDPCAANDDFTPTCATTGGWGLDRYLDHPVSCVDWCDALAYCGAHGKRLCGGIGGGETPIDGFADAAQSEWYAACSSGGENDYVYGDDYVHNRCRESPDIGVVSWGTVAVATLPHCQSSSPDYAGVFDLAGNLSEWVSSCDGTSAQDGCHVRGGAYTHEANALRCDAGSTLRWPRDLGGSDIGLRCCAD